MNEEINEQIIKLNHERMIDCIGRLNRIGDAY